MRGGPTKGERYRYSRVFRPAIGRKRTIMDDGPLPSSRHADVKTRALEGVKGRPDVYTNTCSDEGTTQCRRLQGPSVS